MEEVEVQPPKGQEGCLVFGCLGLLGAAIQRGHPRIGRVREESFKQADTQVGEGGVVACLAVEIGVVE